jgi:hypothetical protein
VAQDVRSDIRPKARIFNNRAERLGDLGNGLAIPFNGETLAATLPVSRMAV